MTCASRFPSSFVNCLNMLNLDQVPAVVIISVVICMLSNYQSMASMHGFDSSSHSTQMNIVMEQAKDDGQWHTDPQTMLARPGPCNIEVRDSSLTQVEFLSKYAFSHPVVLRDVADNSVFREMSRKGNMLKKYGDKVIRLSSANTHSYKKVDVTLQSYVEDYLRPQSLDTLGNETMLWFGDNNHTEWAELFDSYNQPPYVLPKMTGAYSFGLAGAGTGVSFHFHGPGFAEVIFGRKRWFLYPPHQEPRFDPNKTTLHWLLEDYSQLPASEMPYECTIEPGEVIYFPDHWWHGTLNIDCSVFISTFLA